MRLWHQSLIPHLDRQRLLGAHRECCALRGKGWGRKHSVVDYVFTYNPAYLVAYHYLIMNEMRRRGYNPDITWENPDWRGTAIGEQKDWADEDMVSKLLVSARYEGLQIYPEHNDNYLRECIDNLKSKGIEI